VLDILGWQFETVLFKVHFNWDGLLSRQNAGYRDTLPKWFNWDRLVQSTTIGVTYYLKSISSEAFRVTLRIYAGILTVGQTQTLID
jgi:hypothetical protein